MSRIFKGHYFFFILLVLIYPAISHCQFQPTPVERSTEKILYQGKTYFIHTVKQGQTLYSICKAYGVTEQMISAANPGVSINPLSTGINLKIPVTSETRTVTSTTTIAVSEDRNFYYHTIQPGESLYSIHQKYNIPLEVIFEYNPEASQGVKAGQIIRLPKNLNSSASSTSITAQQQTQKKYQVQQGDSIYRVAEKFGITIGDLVNSNRELRWGFKPGQIIIIPDPLLRTPLTVADTLLPFFTGTILSRYQCDSIASLKRIKPAMKVALMLPFYANENFTSESLTDSDSIPDNGSKKSFKGLAAVEFYEGLLLAIDTLQHKNMNISLYVYDTQADTNKVKRILKDLDVIEPDLIIGPMTPENTRLASRFAFEHKIPIVPPLLHDDSALAFNPYVVQTMPSHKDEVDFYARYIAQFNKKNIILITKPGLLQEKENQLFRDALRMQASKYYGVDSLIFTEIHADDAVKKNINRGLKKDKDNLVIVYSTYEPDVINILAHLHFMLREYSIEVFGLPQWQKFDNVRIDVMHELQVTLYTPFNINYSQPRVKSFVKACRNKLKYEPFKTTTKGTGINYAFLGYDLGIYFLEALYDYQKNICDCIENKKSKLLLSEYTFMRNNQVGFFQNKYINIIKYNKEFEIDQISFR